MISRIAFPGLRAKETRSPNSVNWQFAEFFAFFPLHSVLLAPGPDTREKEPLPPDPWQNTTPEYDS